MLPCEFGGQNASRICDQTNTWQPANLTDCFSEVTAGIDDLGNVSMFYLCVLLIIEEIFLVFFYWNQVEVNESNIVTVVVDLSNLVNMTDEIDQSIPLNFEVVVMVFASASAILGSSQALEAPLTFTEQEMVKEYNYRALVH